MARTRRASRATEAASAIHATAGWPTTGKLKDERSKSCASRNRATRRLAGDPGGELLFLFFRRPRSRRRRASCSCRRGHGNTGGLRHRVHHVRGIALRRQSLDHRVGFAAIAECGDLHGEAPRTCPPRCDGSGSVAAGGGWRPLVPVQVEPASSQSARLGCRCRRRDGAGGGFCSLRRTAACQRWRSRAGSFIVLEVGRSSAAGIGRIAAVARRRRRVRPIRPRDRAGSSLVSSTHLARRARRARPDRRAHRRGKSRQKRPSQP